MQIQVNTDHNTDGRDRVAEHVRTFVEAAVSHHSAQITRVEVHLADENGAKAGADDKRCTMEVRVQKRPPLAVTHRASSLNEAIGGAAGKLKRSLDHELARLHEHR
jgi:ribosome-associated translation inhibitor RaiA